jgi:ParE toxin of type II toxin-antitoxin system, parDE
MTRPSPKFASGSRQGGRSNASPLHSRALAELHDAAEYYEDRRANLGEVFLSEVDKSVGQIQAWPNAWPAVSPRARRIRTHRFPYGIVYQVLSDEIFILAVMHLHRRPDYWRDREV